MRYGAACLATNALQLLARDRWPHTAALFARAGLRSGMQVADLGCGGGEVTFEIARIVAPAQVIGVDMDEMKLNLARDAATADGVANVLFRAMNLHDWHETAAYDAVFARFVLHHMREPVAVLRSMWEGVRPGGVLIVEDADFDGWACHPPNPGFEFFKRTYAEIVHRWGGDHAIGRKLPAYFRDAGISRPEISSSIPSISRVRRRCFPGPRWRRPPSRSWPRPLPAARRSKPHWMISRRSARIRCL